MPDTADDLRATAEDLIDDAERMKEIERTKLRLKPGDARLVRLAAETERIVRHMAPKVAAQKELTAEVEGESN